MRTKFNFLKFFLPLILVASFAANAKAGLEVIDTADNNKDITETFAKDGYQNYFDKEQWDVLNYGTGYLFFLDSGMSLFYTQQFQFADNSGDSHFVEFDDELNLITFDDADNIVYGGFDFMFKENSSFLDELVFYISADGEEEKEYTINFAATAALQSPPSATPEPGTLAIFGMSVLVGGLAARRRRNK